MLSDIKDVRVAVMNPASLLSDGLERVCGGAPDFLGRLNAVALVQLNSRVFQKPKAHLGVALHAQLAGFW